MPVPEGVQVIVDGRKIKVTGPTPQAGHLFAARCKFPRQVQAGHSRGSNFTARAAASSLRIVSRFAGMFIFSKR